MRARGGEKKRWPAVSAAARRVNRAAVWGARVGGREVSWRETSRAMLHLRGRLGYRVAVKKTSVAKVGIGFISAVRVRDLWYESCAPARASWRYCEYVPLNSSVHKFNLACPRMQKQASAWCRQPIEVMQFMTFYSQQKATVCS